MKKITRIFKIVILLIFCSTALYAQVNPLKAGTRVYENLINLSAGKALIKVDVSTNGAVFTFPDNKYYNLSNRSIKQIKQTDLQKIKGTAKKTAFIIAGIKNVGNEQIIWQNKEAQNMIELPADLPDGSYQLSAAIYEKPASGLKDILKTNVKFNFVKYKGYITVIMEEALVQ